ncbi:site-2 protease family protein [Actinophytocola xinjiangensis]|uniref:Site-2 protease family protein n=1 Tax=Actinophytocola xinjiangensis TaxID=485602 RepID=A0A7Z0WDV1_9PSEU|nr:site-2 protease family protein [Actinophytocola xinjiangensis]OLF04657.1 site-2 protease family protein [Actinophytocola xinjiangensis]
MQRSAVRPSPVFLAILALAIIGGVIVAFGQGDDYFPGDPGFAVQAGTFLLVLAGWGVSLCLHEFGHAIVAYRGGDREVYFKGYLTLDPRRYTDPIFSLVFPLVLLAIGGIPLPGGAVWINHHALRSRGIDSMVSLAGPLSNLAMGILLIISIDVFEPSMALGGALSFLALFQIMAFVLNILPIPGLDGWGAIEPYLSHDAQRFGAKARPWAPLVLFAVLIGIPAAGTAFWSVADSTFGLFGGDEYLGAVGNIAFFFWR